MNVFLYTEVNMVCFFILLVLVVVMCRNMALTRRDKLLVDMMISVLGLLAVDSLTVISNQNSLPGMRFLNIASNAFQFGLGGVAALLWILYTYMDPDRVDSEKLPIWVWVCILPTAVQVTLSFVSIENGWFFFVDAQNVYHRGPLFFVQVIINVSYLLVSILIAAVRLHNEHRALKKSEYRLITSFGILPVLGGVCQTIFYGIPGVWPATACALLVLVLNVQRNQMYVDALTGINNRGRFNQYLSTQMQELTRYENVYLILMDVDHFKKVNDTYGHLAGDTCLIRVAECLRRAVADTNYFAARYGGDEFAIVCRCRSEDEVSNLIKRVRCEIRAENDALPENEPKTALSIGYAAAERGTQSGLFERLENLINAADASMYEVKRQRHEIEKWGTVPQVEPLEEPIGTK